MKYYFPESGETAEDAVEMIGYEGHSLGYLAESAAKSYHYSSRGFDAEWPIIIAVIDNSGNEKRFSVDREAKPYFFASPIS